MRKVKGIVEQIPIILVWIVVTAMIAIAFLHAIGVWPEEWRF